MTGAHHQTGSGERRGEEGGERRAREVAEAFAIPGRWLGSERWGSGHIHRTWLARFDEGGRTVRYVQQCLNRAVFPEPLRVMENVARVVAHQREALARSGVPDAGRRALELVPARDGAPAFVDADGETWRTWRFVEGTSTREIVAGPADARAAAFAFARFQAQLVDLPAPRLHDTIPRFQDPRWRFEQLEAAARADRCGRLAACRAELDFALARESIVGAFDALRAAGVPERVTHGDTKLNNVLFDDASGEAICVIDLDTVMPGHGLYDFGDLVRTASSRAAEDERALDRVRIEPELFAALAEGWLAGAGALLGDAERSALPLAGRLVTLTIGMRFLADHLAGDAYFPAHRPGHNLDRARVQLRLVAEMEREADRLQALAEQAARGAAE